MRIMLRLITLIAPFWPQMLLAVVCGALTTGAGIALMATSAFLIASAALHPPLYQLSLAIVGVRFFGLSRAVFRYLERYVAHDATFRLLSAIRVWVYQVVERLAPACFRELTSGDLVSRITADVDSLQYFYLRAIAPVFIALTVTMGLAVYLYIYNPELAYLLICFYMGAGVLLPILIHINSRGLAGRLPIVRAAFHAAAVDVIRGIHELSGQYAREWQIKKVTAAGNNLVSLKAKLANSAVLAEAVCQFILSLFAWLALLLLIPMVHNGQLSGIYLAVIVLAVQSSFEAILPLPMVVHYVDESMIAAGRLFGLSETRPAVTDKIAAIETAPQLLTLEVDGLSFNYTGTTAPALTNISFSLKPGQRLAVVGPSGAGKSTLAALLARFWDYPQGSIKLGGIELKDYSRSALSDAMCIIGQQTYLFSASIADNILLAKPAANADELAAAIRIAGLETLIAKLPAGLDTFVGQYGHSLSGGERQRVAIARAALKNAPVLVLDEPVNGLDPVAEVNIMSAIKRLMAGRTTILITHRLAGLDDIDEILVFDKGRIVERGRQEELLAGRGLFSRLRQLELNILYSKNC